ncbi:energy transducer TonB [Yeosuana sp. MJ-SS3]|uniref:Energy transducer TonB n=1 Tax=Gilvirhabdus luticola TaxID=3079858 RepID=A0ABU3U8A2_9FLAO|nr:energy transducer TonB [Yeosuana sp. MJ-SS3]MDU8886637.1 energy transducer TonB [Yeosuana sp. MJ-SS3]
MKLQKKFHELIRQNEKNAKKPQKHDANVQKNSTLFFQIGLILSLLTVYSLFEMEFVTKELSDPYEMSQLEEDVVVVQREVRIYEEIPEKVERRKDSRTLNEPPLIDNGDTREETPKIFTTPAISDNPEIEPVIKVIPPPEEYDILGVERVPIYPGCEKTKNNDERRQCMSEKISRLIQKKFNADLASPLGLSGRQKIDVQFKINKTGKVTDIKTRAPHPRLEKEAERVIKIIPEMTPGRQSNKNVGVIYTLPIIFRVQD